jgi:toxin ParE1/3/4
MANAMKINKKYRLSPLAETDLEEIWWYTVNQWSVKQADSYVLSLIEAFKRLSQGVYKGSDFHALVGYKKHLCGSHVIFYKNLPEYVDIIRMLHQSQDATRHL